MRVAGEHQHENLTPANPHRLGHRSGCGPSAARADFNYGDFSSTQQLNLVGSAAQSGTAIRLTQFIPLGRGNSPDRRLQNKTGRR
ncbi:MAG: hypothetical protein AVDCRST_MAG42-712 [uncultured Chthoniobacterales bacterium]|uniref:Uncharacterized protein n=1 Tax=uncultured Chthoniobacterales bacterium TaxID=1836801 RepID=A0A6J4HH68_9BACT|nr:MAG: hypothetical protein AVDCRST_MAG42-712 [uncultured Chthoniobacterales bacterium]